MEVPEKSADEVKTETQIRERLSALVKDAGGNKEFSKRSGIPLSSLNNYLAGMAMKLGVLIKVADTAGITVDQLIGRELVSSRSISEINDGFVAIPHLEVRASAGPGLASTATEPEAPRQIAFRETWLRSLGITPSNAEFVEAHGDSMFPTIQDGDLMLLDRGYGDVVNGKIYVLVVNGLVVVKRVSLLAFGGLMLISDNDRYPAETVARDEVNNLNFQARVAWFGRPI